MTDATALVEEHRDGRRSVRHTVEGALAAIEALDRELNAFSAIEGDRARARAEVLDREGPGGRPLFGVPVAVKANLCWEGVETHCGSRMLSGYIPPYTATALARLVDAGAVLIGTTHMDEFGMGSSGERSAYGATRNPWDLARTPGGSSSGSAAAVAAGLVPLALGSDTGGSVRQPAAFCGITGIKPTYGSVSRYGLVAYGSSLDQVSPLARSVRDLELVLATLAGPDPRDATSLPHGFTPSAFPLADGSPTPDAPLEGLRFGVPRQFVGDALDDEVRTAFEQACETLRGLGADVVPLSLPYAEHAIPTYYVVATAEASSNLARFDGVRFGKRAPGTHRSLDEMMAATREAGFGEEVQRRILLGTYVLSSGYADAWYHRAQKVRGLLARDFARAFEQVDVVCGPTAPSVAFRIGERTADPLSMYLSDVLTVPASLAGLPALSVPCGLSASAPRLPIGLQLIGPQGTDARVLACARTYQERTDHHLHAPACFAERDA